MTKHVLCLRTCAPDLTSHNGFKWPKKGPVQCDDWKPVAECGNGLHGLVWGVGHAGYLSEERGAKWLVVKVAAADVLDIQDKVKFPRGEVVFCGSRDRAVAYIQKRAPRDSNVVYGRFPRRYKAVTVGGVKAVSDALTGLTWEAAGSADYMTFAEAEKRCAALGPGWRLPTLVELRTIVDYRNGTTHKIDARHFTCSGWWYWSSTPYAPHSGFAWGVHFHYGYSGALGHGGRLYVRAVRPSQGL